MKEYCVILFQTVTQSVWTSRLLKKAGIERKMVPIPRSLSADCGYCVRVLRDDAQRVRELLDRSGVGCARIENYQ
ncbi:MAG: DUF3343 domain-containing protein [Spirochaetes bacterium]|nr:DUF3343 domain-containing protein [Spirochaetota bacterium]